MFVKYVVKKGEEAVVVKFDLRIKRVFFGGYVKFIGLINSLMQPQYFGGKVEEKNYHSQRNKIRYEADMETTIFLEIMDKIMEDFDTKRVQRVDRLI